MNALDRAAALRDAVTAAAKSAAGFDIPNPTALKRRPTKARRFFLARVFTGRRTSRLFMVDGAREPQGSPVRGPVCQPRTVRHSAVDMAGGGLQHPTESTS